MRVVLVWVVVMCITLVAGCGSERASSSAGEDGDAGPTSGELEAELSTSDGEVAGSLESSPYGVGFSSAMTFPDARRVVRVTVEGGGTEGDMSFYPEDYEPGNDEEPLAHDVQAGEQLFVSGLLFPPCADEPADSPPVMELSFTRGGGEVEVERLEVKTMDAYTDPPQWVQVEDVTRAWCDAGVQVRLSRGGLDTDGNARVGYNVVNPGPGEVTLTSRAGRRGDMRWQDAGPVTVPAGGTVPFFVAGHSQGRENCGQPGPLELGLIEVAGPDGLTTITSDSRNGIC